MKSHNVIIQQKGGGVVVEVCGIAEFSVKGAIPSDVNLRYIKVGDDYDSKGVRALKAVGDAFIEIFVSGNTQERMKQDFHAHLKEFEEYYLKKNNGGKHEHIEAENRV